VAVSANVEWLEAGCFCWISVSKQREIGSHVAFSVDQALFCQWLEFHSSVVPVISWQHPETGGVDN